MSLAELQQATQQLSSTELEQFTRWVRDFAPPEDLPELFGNDDFAVAAASRAAILDLQKAGIRVFYFDAATGLEIMKLPNGQKFEIRYTNENADFDVVREIL